MKPRYTTLASIPPMAATLNKLNMGSAPTPTIPMVIGEGATGAIESTTRNLPASAAVRTIARLPLGTAARSGDRSLCGLGLKCRSDRVSRTSEVWGE